MCCAWVWWLVWFVDWIGSDVDIDIWIVLSRAWKNRSRDNFSRCDLVCLAAEMRTM